MHIIPISALLVGNNFETLILHYQNNNHPSEQLTPDPLPIFSAYIMLDRFTQELCQHH